MNKTVDFIALRLTVFLLSLIWLSFLFNFLYAFIAAGIILCAFCIIMAKIADNNKAVISESDFAEHLKLSGNEYTLGVYLAKTTEERHYIENKTLTYANIKFGKTSCDDIAAAYRLTKKHNNLETVDFLTGDIDKNALLLAESIDICFNFIKIKAIYKKLKTEQRLPAANTKKIPRLKIRMKALSETAFSRGATVYYLFSGAILALMSFITPLKIYYLVMSSLLLIMAFLSAVIKK